MSIQTIHNTHKGWTDAKAIPDPKDIWHDGERGIIVFTGPDYDIRHPPLSQDEQDALDARNYAELKALRDMTPAQISTWVDTKVTSLATAQDAIKTLAIAVGVLARRL